MVSRSKCLFVQFYIIYILLVPIIAVFTKLDALVAREQRILASAQGSQLGDEEIRSLARDNADKAFQEECLRIFQGTVGLQVPYKAVSSEHLGRFSIPTS